MKNDFLKSVLNEGSKNFGNISNDDTKLYGQLHGENNLLAFCKFIIPTYESPKHVRFIADALTKVESGEITRLIINIPPRHGKSQLCSQLFPIWYMGRNPKTKLIVASYAAALAQDFTRWQRNTIESDIYREIFPNCLIESDSRSKQKFDTSEGGTVIGAGVDGPITGRGADLAIIDDPFKNYEEAMSELQQEKVWEWYRSTLYTRLHPGAKIIIPMTRWHTNDLSGRLISSQPGKWHVLKLPALNDRNEPLWKERYSLDMYLDIRENSGDKIFSALYQQEPIDIKERLFSDPKYADSPEGLKMFAYLDPAFGGNDFSALTIGAIESKNDTNKIFILHGEIWKTQIDETYNRVVKYCKKFDVSTLYCESNQAQVVICNEFRNRNLFVREVKNTINKHLRIVNSIKTNWSKLYFSNSISENYMQQVLNYSEHARFDDAPDSLAGLIEQFKQTSTSINKRYSFWDWL